MTFNVKIKGIRQTNDLLKRAKKTATNVVNDVPFELSENLKNDLKNEAPVFTGHLRESIFNIRERNGKARVISEAFLPHARFPGGPKTSERSYALFPDKGLAKPSSAGYIQRGIDLTLQRVKGIEKVFKKFT